MRKFMCYFLVAASVFNFGVVTAGGEKLLIARDIANEDTANIPKDWFLKDPETDHLQGISVEKTYMTLLQGKPSKTVLVAVIDSGIDIEHEDLKDVIWTNEDEIEHVRLDDLAERVLATSVVPYPPGIPMLMPGEYVRDDSGA